MKKIYYTIAIMLFLSNITFAQISEDALRWSQNIYEGSARFTSMGGAFTALGGDASALSVNPAGLGVYRASELSLTPSFDRIDIKAKMQGQNSFKETKNRGGFSFGYIQPFMLRNDNKGLVALNFGIAYNQLNNFSKNTYAYQKSTGEGSSWLDAVTKKAQNHSDLFDPAKMTSNDRFINYHPDDWDVVLAYNNKLIEHDALGYYTPLAQSDLIGQNWIQEEKGRNTEIVTSIGANIANKLFIGLNIGIQYIDYTKEVTIKENVLESTVSPPTELSWFDYKRYIETEGSGTNVKLGLIYRPIDNLRIGAAYHSPTRIMLTDYYQTSMQSKFSNEIQTVAPEKSPTTPGLEYKIKTPAKYILGFAYIFEDYGLISIDYEYVDYKTIHMQERYRFDNDNPFAGENELIKQDFKGTSNIRFGLEGKFTNSLSVRGGYALYGSPFKNSNDPDIHMVSLGMGYRTAGFFIDAGYRYLTTKSQYNIYSNSKDVKETQESHQILCTLGFRF